METTDEKKIDPIREMKRIAQGIMILDSWGFKESYISARLGRIIYNSEFCRLSLVWGGWDYGGGNSIHIYYGRLHAPSEMATMSWNGEECHCWHDIDYALHFLDKRTPGDAAALSYSHPLMNSFYDEEFRKNYDRRQPEWLAKMHLAIWQFYGKRLFELFDLRQPDLWQQYRQFLKGVYDIEGRIPAIKPSLDKVC
jgi:hypothetical protein